MTRDYLLPSHLPIHDRPKTQKKSLSSAALSSNLKKARLFTSDSSEICCLYVCWHWIYCANAESQRTSTPAEVHIPDLLLLYSCRGWTARCNKLQGHNKLRSIILLPMQDCQVPHIISSQAFCKGLSEDFFPVNKKRKKHFQHPRTQLISSVKPSEILHHPKDPFNLNSDGVLVYPFLPGYKENSQEEATFKERDPPTSFKGLWKISQEGEWTQWNLPATDWDCC